MCGLGVPHLRRHCTRFEALRLRCRLCEHGTLLQHLRGVARAGGVLLERHTATLMAQLLRAVAVCHTNGIMHRDVKLENLLMSAHGGPSAALRLADFGTADVFHVGRRQRAHVRVGTERYMAPEVFKGDYGYEADVFSCGVVMHFLLTQRVRTLALQDSHYGHLRCSALLRWAPSGGMRAAAVCDGEQDARWHARDQAPERAVDGRDQAAGTDDGAPAAGTPLLTAAPSGCVLQLPPDPP